MTSDQPSSDDSSERLGVPEEAIVEETDGGRLVFIETQPGMKELIGFVGVSSVDVLRDELRIRGIDSRAVYDTIRYPTFEQNERPEDCDCLSTMEGLGCWPCYRDGFEEPNPDLADDE